ncbi:uncharacterized protein [Amphiura filiformis]|uniref:uncharacterized protein n=1 Tax=Amphiura filiformis TaxID=82378 RepID=UPI003B227014
MALVMKLRSRCKKGCECENGTNFHSKYANKSNKPTAIDAKVAQTTSGTWVVSNAASNPPVLTDSKENRNLIRKSSRSKMSSHTQKNTKENQNCKTMLRKAGKRGCSEYPKTDADVPVKVQKLASTKSSKEHTKCSRQMIKAESLTQEPKKELNADIVVKEKPMSETVPKDTVAIVKSVTARTRRKNPRRKCVRDSQGASSHRGRSKISLKKQTSVETNEHEIVCDSVDIQKHVPSTSASSSSSSFTSITTETQKITSKTKLLEEQVAELKEEISKENEQIARLKRLLSKRQVVKGVVEKKKQQVQQVESRKLMRSLDRKESEMEKRATQLEKRLQTEVKINQKEMQKFKKELNSRWQKQVDRMQSTITKMRHELRTKVMSWRKEKESLEHEMEQKLEGQKKTYSRHKYFKTCKRQLKQMQVDLEKQKLEVEKDGKSDADKTVQLKKLDAELSELKMLMNLISMSPKEHMKAMAKKKAKERLSNLIEEDLQCLICAEILIQATVLNCSHTFCKHCITRWTKRKDLCPVCRTTITSKFSLENLDRYIDKVVDKFDDAFKERRKKALDDRTEQERQLRRQIEAGYFDEHSDSDSSDDDFWDVWDDDDDEDLSIDLDDDDDDDADDAEGSWDDWDDDLLSDNNDDVSSDSSSSSDTDGDFNDDDFNDDGDSDGDSYDCVIC